MRGWSCPWCIVKAKSWLRQMSPGQVLKVISTDPEAQINFPRVLERCQDRLISVEQHEDYYHLFIQRG